MAKDRTAKARDFLFGEVMKANPRFDPALVSEELDAALAMATAAMDEAHDQGRLTPEAIRAAIDDHRRRHPYRPGNGPTSPE
jgi:hypothetical protein